MKNIFTILFVFVLTSAHAANYYFSSVSGDDSRTSTQAKSPSTPWKSLDKLGLFFASLQPGDSALFKRGETFSGALKISRSGIKGAPIVLGAYGTGNKPVLSALTTLTNWVAVGNGIYESYNPSLGTTLNIVLLNDVQQAMGRYPNKGYLTIESHSGSTSITDNELPSTPNWKGAELVIRPSRWVMNRHLITSHSGNTLYFSGTAASKDKYGYFIQNSVKALDRLGEWCYNATTKKVSMYFGSASPASFSVRASTGINLIHAGDKSFIVFDNLTLKGANENGFGIHSGSGFIVKNCEVLFSGINGVYVSGHTGFRLENSTVINSNNDGVNASATSTITNNYIKNSYSIAGLGQNGDGMGAGVRVTRSSLVEYNRIINSGFLGIQFTGDSTIIKNNYIDTFCFVKDGGGGIYVPNPGRITRTGRKVIGNIVLNGIGAPEGTDITVSNAEGIYMDDDCNAVEIIGNTVANCHRGLYMHNSRNIVIRNNTCFNNTDGQLNMKYDGLGGLLRNHTITNNIFFSKYAAHVASAVLTKNDNSDIAAAGRFDSNYYARPMANPDIIFTTTYLYSSTQRRVYLDLSEWKTTYNEDPASKLSIKTIDVNPDVNIKFVYNATQETKTIALDGNYVDAKNIRYSNSITLRPYSSAVLIRDGSVPVNTPPTVSIISPVTNANFNAPASVTINAVAADVDGRVSKVEFYNGNTLLGTDTTSPYAFTWNNVAAGNYTITAKATDNGSLVTTSSAVLITVHAANVAPSVSITSPVANATFNAPASVIINAVAADADGKVSKVEFYNGATLLGTDTSSPYTFTWNNLAAGNYSITAKATDNGSLVTTSAAVAFSVYAATGAPSVSITSPVANATFNAPASITINATAADADGKVTKVEFYNGGTLLATDTSSPYTFTWNNVAAGTYTITATATDNNSLVATSAAVTISVDGTNIAPFVTIIGLSTNTPLGSAASVIINAAAADADGTISKVEFYNGDTLLGTVTAAPHTFAWNDVAPGSYTITAKATDNKGAVTTSSKVTISVVPPIVSQRPINNTPANVGAASLNLKLFPNPASNTIFVSGNGLPENKDFTISILSINGVIVKTLRANTSDKAVEVNISSLSAGVYYIKATAQHITLNKQFVKM